jgi:hypothetical protein
MLYTPISGTPLYEKHKQEGTLLAESEFPDADSHGQYRFNYRHPYIKGGQEEKYILEAFWRDFNSNGPSILRLIRVLLNGWQMYKDHPGRVRKRFAWEVFPLRSTYAGAVWAIRKWYRNDARIAEKADILLTDIYATFGWKTKVIAPLIGRYTFFALKKEEERLALGWSYEPCCSYEKNETAKVLETAQTVKHRLKAQEKRSVVNEPIPHYGK